MHAASPLKYADDDAYEFRVAGKVGAVLLPKADGVVVRFPSPQSSASSGSQPMHCEWRAIEGGLECAWVR